MSNDYLCRFRLARRGFVALLLASFVLAGLVYQVQAASPTGVHPAPAVAQAGGDPAAGMALFTGAVRLTNGGPACISCHTVSQTGAFGGGTLGPDLTNVYGRYGQAGLAASLKTLAFPTMRGVFANQPLTPEEITHLQALFVETDQSVAEPMNYTFVLIGVVGCALLGLLSHFIWEKRHAGVRIPLVRR
jgi:mono/diheme cytochrome c family protein